MGMKRQIIPSNRWFWWTLAVLPFFFLAWATWHNALDFPFFDQWHFAPDVLKAFEGTLTLGDLWRPHNEHRIFFPKLMMLVLARLSHWNVGWEIAANTALGVAIFTVWLLLFRLSARRLSRAVPPWTPVLLSLAVFSFSQ